jgi:hypothetical protein
MILIWRKSPEGEGGFLYVKLLHKGKQYDLGNFPITPGCKSWGSFCHDEGHEEVQRVWSLIDKHEKSFASK